jgi:hypothetical protein
MASNAGSSPTKRAWAVRQHAATETVANSAIQGFIQALGVFIDTSLPQPREVFRHPPSSSVLTVSRNWWWKLLSGNEFQIK